MFKKSIEQFGCTIVPVNSKGLNMMHEFIDLRAKCRGADIIFETEGLSAETTMDYLVTEICMTVNIMLTRTYKVKSQHILISQIYGVMWLEEMSGVYEASEPSNKRRKKGEEIGYTQMNRYGKQVYEFVSSSICAADESPTIYINAAVRESAYRSSGGLDAVHQYICDSDEDDTDLQMSQVLLYPTSFYCSKSDYETAFLI